MDEHARRLESDLTALATRLRTDETFADELYCALCNSDWRHDDGTEWRGSWRYSAGVVADLRELGECYSTSTVPQRTLREPSPSASPPPWRSWDGTAPDTAASCGSSTSAPVRARSGEMASGSIRTMTRADATRSRHGSQSPNALSAPDEPMASTWSPSARARSTSLQRSIETTTARMRLR